MVRNAFLGAEGDKSNSRSQNSGDKKKPQPERSRSEDSSRPLRRRRAHEICPDVLLECKGGKVYRYRQVQPASESEVRQACPARQQGPFFCGGVVIAIADLEFAGLQPMVVPAGSCGIVKALSALDEETKVEVQWTNGPAAGCRGAVPPQELFPMHRPTRAASPLRDASGEKVLALSHGANISETTAPTTPPKTRRTTEPETPQKTKRRKPPSSAGSMGEVKRPRLDFDFESACWNKTMFS